MRDKGGRGREGGREVYPCILEACESGTTENTSALYFSIVKKRMKTPALSFLIITRVPRPQKAEGATRGQEGPTPFTDSETPLIGTRVPLLHVLTSLRCLA